MKYLVVTSLILAMILPDMAFAKHCHGSGRHIIRHKHRRAESHKIRHGETIVETNRGPIVIQRDVPPAKAEIAEINLDAGAGRTLRQLLSDNLGAEVEWGNRRLGDRVVTGSYRGSPEFVAQQLLKDFQFAIYYNHSRLRIIVLRASAPEVVADNRPRIPLQPQVIPPQANPNVAPKPAADRK